MKCVFCQNHQISHEGVGLEVSPAELMKCMLYLQSIGAENINIVTPPQNVNLLANVLRVVRTQLTIPIVWNSSGYETVANLKKLEGLVDIYLPDFKYSDNNLAQAYSGVPNYLEVAREAIREMRRQCPVNEFDDDGMMTKGVIVRHLVLPRGIRNTVGVMQEIASIDKKMYVSVMGQYFPTPAVSGHPVLGRRINQLEYNMAVDAFFDAGLSQGFSQELDSATEEYVPDFNLDELKKILGR